MEATPKQFSPKKMKKQVVKELEKLVKGFNAKNENLDMKPYELTKPDQFKRGHYTITLEYKMMPSTDLTKLMEFAKENGLTVWLSMSQRTNTPRINMI